ncbi:MAG TPA: hypothetical protein VGM92_01270, partial [Candidatus Kapabacteria bacterium]
MAAQQRSLSVTLTSASDSVIVLSDNFPDFSSLSIQVDGGFFLQAQKEFSIDTASRAIHLSAELRQLLFPMNAAPGVRHTLAVNYIALPISLKTSYSRHELETPHLNDSLRTLLDSSKQGLEHIST